MIGKLLKKSFKNPNQRAFKFSFHQEKENDFIRKKLYFIFTNNKHSQSIKF